MRYNMAVCGYVRKNFVNHCPVAIVNTMVIYRYLFKTIKPIISSFKNSIILQDGENTSITLLNLRCVLEHQGSRIPWSKRVLRLFS